MSDTNTGTVSEEKSDTVLSLYNINDGLQGRDGGPYHDIQEAKRHEERSAFREGRKPDFSQPLSGAGIQAVTAAEMLSAHKPAAGESAEITAPVVGTLDITPPEPSAKEKREQDKNPTLAQRQATKSGDANDGFQDLTQF